MSEITITIDGKECGTQEGEFILNVARANEIFIPALCYISRCSPTLACRVCLVESDGKQVYACNAKAKDGMNIVTSTQNIEEERRAIMEVYDLNHPLQCGVCDQSGECDLQNYSTHIGVDEQSHSIVDVNRPTQDWGYIHYDSSLCIVCEKCVTTCKDMIGDGALKSVPRGGEPLSKELKTQMPKDAYAMWNKLNKSIIGTVSGETLDCTDCGECISVCPVGALVSSDYQYATNSWELEKIPATCAHCSAGCSINYERKHTDVGDSELKLYRVTNEWNYTSLCGAGRFGYDFENRGAKKDKDALNAALKAIESAGTLLFDSTITNEEAMILQKLKEKKGFKLVNREAKEFKKFLDSYSTISGKQLYGSDLKRVHNSDFVVSIGAAIKSDNPSARYAFNNALAMNKGAGIYFHPVSDSVVDEMNKNLVSINHSAGLEEAALYLLLDLFGDKQRVPESIKSFLDGFHSTKTVTVQETIKESVTQTVTQIVKDEESGEEREVTKEVTKMVPKKVSKDVEVDENRLFEILNAPDDFVQKLEKMLAKKEKFSLIVGEDLYGHEKSENIARLVALVEKYTPFELVMIPSSTNTLGVSLICELDDEAEGSSVGYNVEADFTLSATGDGDIDMPALNQQEGTFTTINKRVVPTNVALDYGGYTLNDIANALGLEAEHTVEYTQKLASVAGFKDEKFDNLPDYFTNSGEEVRGYTLDEVESKLSESESVNPFDEKSTLNGELIYLANPVNQFSKFTNVAHQLSAKGGVFLSVKKAERLNVVDGDTLEVKTLKGVQRLQVTIDNKISGDIAYISTFDSSVKGANLFGDYRFIEANLTKV